LRNIVLISNVSCRQFSISRNSGPAPNNSASSELGGSLLDCSPKDQNVVCRGDPVRAARERQKLL
jgi:hypothetical protein